MDRQAIRRLAEILNSPLQERQRNLLIRCPFGPVTHAGGLDRKPAFSIRVRDYGPSECVCYACGVGGRRLLQLFEKAHEITGLYEEALVYLRETEVHDLGSAFTQLRRGRLPLAQPERAYDLERYLWRCGKLVPCYVLDRGLGRREVDRWRIGHDRERGRAVFPIWDYQGRLVGATRRTVRDQDPKYLDTPGLPKDSVFYGEHLIDSTIRRAVLVEGPFDVINTDRAGVRNVLGLLGAHTGVSGERLRKLRRWAREVVLLLDGDLAGHEAVVGSRDSRTGRWLKRGLLPELRDHFVVRVAVLPAGLDPGAATQDQLLCAIANSSYAGLTGVASPANICGGFKTLNSGADGARSIWNGFAQRFQAGRGGPGV